MATFLILAHRCFTDLDKDVAKTLGGAKNSGSFLRCLVCFRSSCAHFRVDSKVMFCDIGGEVACVSVVGGLGVGSRAIPGAVLVVFYAFEHVCHVSSKVFYCGLDSKV